MNRAAKSGRLTPTPLVIAAMIASAAASGLTGCSPEADSFLFDQSKTGYFEHTPTMIPVLERLHVIEGRDDFEGNVTSVVAADLLPSDLTYFLSPGDILGVEIEDLLGDQRLYVRTLRLDASGAIRLPYVGEVQAAGRTIQDLEDAIVQRLEEQVMENPRVSVTLEDGGGFSYTLYGFTPGPGIYALRRADFRLMEALALAGGVGTTVSRVYVIRQVELDEKARPLSTPPRTNGPDGAGPGGPPAGGGEPSIDDLIDLIEDDDGGGAPAPGALARRQDQDPLVDIDDLKPARPAETPEARQRQRQSRENANLPPAAESFVWIEERGAWAPAGDQAGGDGPVGGDLLDDPGGVIGAGDPGQAVLTERVIEIPIQDLLAGDSSYNVVIRPRDRIFVKPPESGAVYIDGEILRPGVFALPDDGGRLTLSRLIAAAGGFNGIAQPERVDLTRVVGPAREATIRVDLAAIRARAEPDIYLKADDHVIVGTSAQATFLAIIRGGFRFTYGFGFLLDRNFGNDVFGAPPSNFNN